MDLWHSINGMVALRITCADPSGILTLIHDAGIILHQVSMPDELTLRVTVRRQDVKTLHHVLKNKGVNIQRDGKKGVYWRLRSVLRRPMMVGGVLFLFLLCTFLPTRVFFFRVEGNENVPTRLILEQAASCGLDFGASRRAVRSEKVKNALLQAVPQLQWAGVNTSGCVATISVRERQETSDQDDAGGVSSIIATRDGIIQEVTVTGGNPLCKVGQAVKKGQILISGYTDCGISIRAERAKGEVYAVTDHKITAFIPTDWSYRGEKQTVTKKYGLIIGKKRINFYKGSGILDTGCVKMYEEKFLTLPGGLQLPFAFVTEVWVSCSSASVSASVDEFSSKLSDLTREHLLKLMIAGRILSQNETVSQSDGVLKLEGKYGCLEMIGREQSEEILAP